MATRLFVLLSGVALASAAGCSTTRSLAQPSQPTARNAPDYVAQVEQIARQRGVRVHWVNPPLKPR